MLTQEALANRVRVTRGVDGNGLSSRIVKVVHSRKDSAHHIGGGNITRTATVAVVDDLVVVEEAEHLLLQNRTTHREAEVVKAEEWNLPRLELRMGGQSI